MAGRKRSPGNPWPKLLKQLRAKHGITQASAARQTEVALRTWINWEAGHQQPSTLAIALLRKAFPELF